MSLDQYRVRRATLEDLDALRALWASHRLPVADLERRLTEFQVVEDGVGKVVGGLGFCTQLRHGLVHSEAFADFSIADHVRSRFWTRIQSLVLNHGLVRLWTPENSPFWSRNGFQAANTDVMAKLPAAWAQMGDKWLTLQIKDEEAVISIEKEIDVWMKNERLRTHATFEKAKTLKTAAAVIGTLVSLLLLAAAGYVYFKHQSAGLPPH